MTDLIARIEAAQPSEARELIEEVWAAVHGGGPQWCQYYSEDIDLRHEARSYSNKLQAEAYLDAAAMLVPEGWSTHLIIHPADPADASNPPITYADCYLLDWADPTVNRGKLKHCEAEATTPYFALLSAAMKARQTDERD